MPLKINYKVLWLCSCIYFALTCKISICQTLNQTLQKADSCLRINDVLSAYKLYQRVYILRTDTFNESAVIENLAKCSEILGYHDDAYKYYKQIRSVSENDSLYSDYVLKEYKNGLISRQYKELFEELKFIDTSILNKKDLIHLNFYCGLACIQLNENYKAIAYFNSILPNLNYEDSSCLVLLINKYKKNGHINNNRIKNYSLLMPGLGQLVMKDYKNALNSFVLNALLLGGFATTSINYSLLESTLFWASPITHYYLGGANSAYSLSLKKQLLSNNNYYNDFVKAITSASYK